MLAAECNRLHYHIYECNRLHCAFHQVHGAGRVSAFRVWRYAELKIKFSAK